MPTRVTVFVVVEETPDGDEFVAVFGTRQAAEHRATTVRASRLSLSGWSFPFEVQPHEIDLPGAEPPDPAP